MATRSKPKVTRKGARPSKGTKPKPQRKTARGSPAKSPGSRDVFKRRVTTYDLTLEERSELTAIAETIEKSLSELVALSVRALLAGYRAAASAGTKSGSARMRGCAEELAKLQMPEAAALLHALAGGEVPGAALATPPVPEDKGVSPADYLHPTAP